MREDQVANAVTFLTHPKVKQAPVEERISFLKNKGLTQEELEEALKRADQKATSATEDGAVPTQAQQQPSQQPPPQLAPFPSEPVQQESSWVNRVLVPGTLALSAGAGLAFLYKTMVLKQGMPQQWFGPPPPPIPPTAQPPPFPQPPTGGLQDRERMEGQSREHALPGAPGAKDALIAQGKPVPTAESFAMTQSSHMENSGLVPFDASSMFGKAPYASGMMVNGGLSGASGANEEMVTLLKQQGELLKDVGDSLKSVSLQLAEMKQSNNSSSFDAVSKAAWISTLSQAQSDLKAELNTIKTLLLSGNSPSQIAEKLANDTSSTSASDQEKNEKAPNVLDNLIKAASDDAVVEKPQVFEPEDPITNEEIAERKMEESRKALGKLVESCPKDKLRPAVNLLLMYLGNLAKDPKVPRYTRISRSNSSYTSNLGKVEYHLDFLKANGFTEKSSSMGMPSRTQMLEWSDEWKDNIDNWSVQVLKDSIANLEKISKSLGPVGRAQSSPVITPATPPAAPVAEEEEKRKTSFTAQPFVIPSFKENVESTNASTPVPPSEQDKKRTWYLNDTQQETSASVVGENETQVEGLQQQQDERGSSHEGAPTPLSYSQVCQMLKEGKQPPGIKQIPNQLSVDASNPSVSTMKPLPKPWEEVSNGGENENTAMDDEAEIVPAIEQVEETQSSPALAAVTASDSSFTTPPPFQQQ